MRERARRIRSEFQQQSRAGEGTEIVVSLLVGRAYLISGSNFLISTIYHRMPGFRGSTQ